MGSHYVQQALLRHFEDPANPGFIWTYVRGNVPRLAAISKVAQSPGFYDPDVEKALNEYVEEPATPVLDALRGGEIDTAHAYRLANPPSEVLDQIRDPRPTQEMVDAIKSMSWRLLIAAPPEMFLTSDDPVFYFEGLGLGNADSEFAFPLSPTHCLHGCNQPLRGDGLEIRLAERQLVHEMNRRMANNATKLLFASKRAKFPTTLLRKGNSHFLSRINWTYKEV